MSHFLLDFGPRFMCGQSNSVTKLLTVGHDCFRETDEQSIDCDTASPRYPIN